MSLTKPKLKSIADDLEIDISQLKAVKGLLEGGNTIPFIARYRKEKTGSLDEVQIREIRDQVKMEEELQDRRRTILSTLSEQGNLTDQLREKIEEADSRSQLEDIYLPYRPKRKTKASIAKKQGLEPLTKLINRQEDGVNPVQAAEGYINPEEGVERVDDALAGARDIIAEWINQDKNMRQKMRKLFSKNGLIKSNLRNENQEESDKYRDYYDYKEPAKKAPSHRILAIFRGEKEEVLRVKIRPPEESALQLIYSQVVQNDNLCTEQVKEAAEDCYHRLLGPSMENELRNDLKERADLEAVQVFATNLRQLLMAPPLGEKSVMGIDPGFRSGCKVVCLDSQGSLLEAQPIFPHSPQDNPEEAAEIVKNMIIKHRPEAIALGDGTASRETESFMRNLDVTSSLIVTRVSEDGASVYSASEIGREEFPDKDVTVRGAVSIGRRLMDPLAELVKIDPQALGIGQYQHDIDRNLLKSKLEEVVESCVNSVGVDLNTASKQLLTYVSGLGDTLAENIINYRQSTGKFRNIDQLKEVSRIGNKTFQQAAGFLRINNGDNPLDRSGVHPESYPVVKRMASDLGTSIGKLMEDSGLRRKIEIREYVSENIGIPTLEDILSELEKPGRDPRDKFQPFSFSEQVRSIEDVNEGMILPGIISNITNFGAFVDLGIKRDGLIHISELSDFYVDDPNDVVKLKQRVSVKVLNVDKTRGRISLSLKL